MALLREVAESGVVIDDPRLRYVEVQVDRDTWECLQRGVADGYPGPPCPTCEGSGVVVTTTPDGSEYMARCGECNGTGHDRLPESKLAAAIAQRDHWIRMFNRLEVAISHHKRDCEFTDGEDDRLWAARDRILRQAATEAPHG